MQSDVVSKLKDKLSAPWQGQDKPAKQDNGGNVRSWWWALQTATEAEDKMSIKDGVITGELSELCWKDTTGCLVCDVCERPCNWAKTGLLLIFGN